MRLIDGGMKLGKERNGVNVNEKEKERNSIRERERELGTFSMMGFDSATFSSLASLIIKSNTKVQNLEKFPDFAAEKLFISFF